MPMTFLTATQVCVAKYADFNGKATRAEYWWFLLAILIGSVAASINGPMVYALFSAAALLPMMAVGARRLHDTNRSGWWQLLAVVPFGIFVVALLLALPSNAGAKG
jgi:uncharacterized membrane protein YhaH (DUF805 family)